MTRDEILKMSAGKEMDALIAVEVMGYEYNERHDYCFSTDIAAAWLVVEKMTWCEIEKHPGWTTEESETMTYWTVTYEGRTYLDCVDAETAPLAICRAALLAVLK